MQQFTDLYTWGSDFCAQLGHCQHLNDNDLKDITAPKRVRFFLEANISLTQVSAGETHTIALTSTGSFDLIESFPSGSTLISL